MLNFDSETLCLTLTELHKNYYNITSLLLTLKGPKGPTFRTFRAGGGGGGPPAPLLNPPLDGFPVRAICTFNLFCYLNLRIKAVSLNVTVATITIVRLIQLQQKEQSCQKLRYTVHSNK